MPKSKMTDKQREALFWSRVDKNGPVPTHCPELGPCWEWTGATNGPGYGKFCDGKIIEMTHRYSWRIVCGDIPKGIFVCHKCDNPPCCRPDHLFLGTQSDNSKDAYKKGRTVRARQNKMVRDRGYGICHKMTKEIGLSIIELRIKKWSQQTIADYLGISQSTVTKWIAAGCKWEGKSLPRAKEALQAIPAGDRCARIKIKYNEGVPEACYV